MKAKKVGLYANDFNWAGGIDFIYFLYKGLVSGEAKYEKIYLLLDEEKEKSIALAIYSVLKKIAKLLIGRTSISDFWRSIKDDSNKKNMHLNSSIKEQYISIFTGEDVEFLFYSKGGKSLDETLKDNNIDVILPVLNPIFDKSFFVPFIGYIFDFTHRYNPSFYSFEHYLQSDIKFAETLLKSKVIITNSNAVKEDIYKFYPTSVNRVFNLPFTPFVNEHTVVKAINNKDSVLSNHRINKPYFIICNQMWPHKNHEVAFRALDLLMKKRGKYEGLNIVCTGSKTDLSGTESRYLNLVKYAEDLGLNKSIHFLGHIDKVDQVALVIESNGLIQPTTFEGGPGGGSVYLALALNKPCLISDIPINREIIDFPNTFFFEPNDDEQLAQHMEDLLNRESELGIDQSDLMIYQERLKKLGDRLHEAIQCAIDLHQKYV